jgi:mannose-6-phosphate isomerase-like protein (cupin superfamily)
MTKPGKQFLLTYPNLENAQGEVVLENEHLVLQRLIVGPGEWEGVHSHPGNQLYVHIKGGEWSGRLGGKTEYSADVDEDGAVGWMDAIPLSAEHDSGNTGDTPIDLIYVTLKGDGPIAPGFRQVPQTFPDVPLELLLENDLMIAQRVWIEPGQWTGTHSHPGNQVYIHITGGAWAERRDGVLSPPSLAQAGSAGWIDAVDSEQGHEHGNAGDSPMHLVLVTLK